MKDSKLILVVDDDEAIQMTLRLALEDEGYHVESAFSAPEALKQLEKGESKPDLIILDLYMPEMGGIEFSECLKTDKFAHHKNIPIIISSATNKPVEKEAASHFNYFLPKPFNLKTLLEVCHRFTQD